MGLVELDRLRSERAVEWPYVMVAALTLAAIALFREAYSSSLDSLWAEDGRVFLVDALSDRHVFLDTYNGYVHVVPRILAEVVVVFRPELWPVAIGVLAGVVTAAIAVFTFLAAESLVGSKFLRGLLAAWLIMNPVTGEVGSNLANLHWLLLVGAFWAFFAPLRMRTASSIVVAAAALSNPITGLLGLIGLVDDNRRSLGMIAFGGAIFHVAARFVGDATVTPELSGPSLASIGPGIGLLAWAVMAGLVGRWLAGHLVALPFLAAGFLSTAVILLRYTFQKSLKWFYLAGLTLAVGVAVGGAVLRGLESSYQGLRFGFVSAAIALSLVLASIDRLSGWAPIAAGTLVFAITLNFVSHTRIGAPEWSEALTSAECETGQVISVPIHPEGWFVELPCETIRPATSVLSEQVFG